MDFKRIITAMSIMGLISCPTFAGQHVKHHHHRSRHKAVAAYDYKNDQNDKADTNYKDMALVAAPCAMSQSALILNDMNQNHGRAIPNRCDTGWYKRIRWNGGVTVDWLKLGNPGSHFMGVNYQRLSINDAYLNLGVDVNRWAKAFASISYDTTTINNNAYITLLSPLVREYSAPYSNNVTGSGALHALQLEQAYATLGNLEEAPVFVQVGKQFQDFGRYTIHPITRSLTQSLSEILATSARLGFIFPSGFYGSAAVFNNPIQQFGSISKNTATNYTLALGYDQKNDSLGFDVGASWVQNLVAANDIAYNIYQFSFDPLINNYGYAHKVSGVALYGDVKSGPFRIGAHYASALKRFNLIDLPRYGVQGIANGNLQGAKPWAADVQVDYGFDGMGMNATQDVYVGYQASRDTSSLGLPKSRWVLGYHVAPCKNTAFALEWDRDRDHSKTKGGTGKRYNLVTLRSTVKFG